MKQKSIKIIFCLIFFYLYSFSNTCTNFYKNPYQYSLRTYGLDSILLTPEQIKQYEGSLHKKFSNLSSITLSYVKSFGFGVLIVGSSIDKGFIVSGYFERENDLLKVTDQNGNSKYISLSLLPEQTTFSSLESIDPKERVSVLKEYPLKFNILDPTKKIREKFIDAYLQNGSFFSNPILYEYLTSDRSNLKSLVYSWVLFPIEKMIGMRTFRTGSYGKSKHLDQSTLIELQKLHVKYINMLTEVEDKLGWKYLSLLMDPAIVNRYNEFKIFYGQLVSTGKLPNDPFELRELFSQSLGEIKVYRVLATFNKNLKQNILNNGLKNKYLYSLEDKEVLRAKLKAHLNPLRLDDMEGGGIFQEYYEKTKLGGVLAVSVTQIPKFGAFATGYPMINTQGGPAQLQTTKSGKVDAGLIQNAKKIIIEMRLPAISVSHAEIFKIHPAVPDLVTLNDHSQISFLSKEAESFIFDDITPEQIISIKTIIENEQPFGSFEYKDGASMFINY